MSATVPTRAREIVYRTRGQMDGAITRLVSPGELGGLLKPFVFLDLFDFKTSAQVPDFGMHPHSGIATLTYMFDGDVSFRDTTGKSGLLRAGGVEWMRAGSGVWHGGAPVTGSRVMGFQLWLALPPAEENAEAQSQYLSPEEVPGEGPARVLLGQSGSARSAISAPSPINYLAVRLTAGQRWTYMPPSDQTVGWIAVASGALTAGGPIDTGELAVFNESDEPIDIEAHRDTMFVLGSAVKHPYDLVLGSHSVHTSKEALGRGEAEIHRINAQR